MKILMLFFSSNLNYTLLNLIQKLDSRKFISCWNEWKIANFYADAGKETRFYNVQDIKRGRWRVFPWCRRRETREELWIRNLLSRETKFAPYETNSNLYRERFAEQTKLPTIYIYIYLRTYDEVSLTRECPSQVLAWFSFQFFKLPRDHTFGFHV